MSQKVENLLNLALDATEEERVRSLELEVGYNPIEREMQGKKDLSVTKM